MPPRKKPSAAAAAGNSVDANTSRLNYELYLKQLEARVVPLLYQSMKEIYQDAVDHCTALGNRETLKVFRQLLREVCEWEEDEVEEESERFHDATPWLRNVVQQIVVAKIHILLSVKNDTLVAQPKFSFEMPSFNDIVFRFVCAAAKVTLPYAKSIVEGEEEEYIVDLQDALRDALPRVIEELVPLTEIVNSQFGGGKPQKKQPPKKKAQKPPAKGKKKKQQEEEEEEDLSISSISSSSSGEKTPREEDLEKMERKSKILSSRQENLKKEKEEEDKKKEPKLELIAGEEHVDDGAKQPQHSEDDLLEAISKLKPNDPQRKVLREKLKKLLDK